MMKIFLIGYRCTGKTTVGKIIADRLNFRFLDTDHMVETSENRTVRQIVDSEGWQEFRELEKKALLSLELFENIVVATGGGIILDPDNINFLKKNGTAIWLESDIEMIVQRLNTDRSSFSQRPEFTDMGLKEETKKIMSQRRHLYEDCSDFRIDTSVESPETISLKIIDYILKHNSKETLKE